LGLLGPLIYSTPIAMPKESRTGGGDYTLPLSFKIRSVLHPEKGECADPVNEDAILKVERGGESQDRNRERQLASDSGGGKT
jgi:hypothetical protein